MVRRVVVGLLMVVATVGLAEGLVRVIVPTPRAQVLDAARLATLGDVDGVPVWTVPSDRPVGLPECVDGEQPQVILAGSSILFGSGVKSPETLEARLRERLPDVCVVNLAQPAFGAQQKGAVVAQWLQAHRVDLLVWEAWRNDPARYVRDGDLIVSAVADVDERDEGSTVHRALFRDSRLYRLGALAWAPAAEEAPPSRVWKDQVVPIVDRTVQLVAAQDGQVLIARFPALDVSFETSADGFAPYGLLDPLGVQVVDIARALAVEDHEALRFDPCCHYNGDGLRAVAEVLAPLIEKKVGAEPAPVVACRPSWADTDPGPWGVGGELVADWTLTEMQVDHPEFVRLIATYEGAEAGLEIRYHDGDVGDWATEHYQMMPAPGSHVPGNVLSGVREQLNELEVRLKGAAIRDAAAPDPFVGLPACAAEEGGEE